MLFYESKSVNPYYNLAMEEYFFSQMDPTREYFLLWQNDRAVIVGRYQNTLEEVDQQYIDEHGILVARRLSGGGAVYHDMGNLNYTFIVDESRAESFCFETFVIPLIKTLAELGIYAETSGRNDVTIDGRKISGSSQYMKGGRLLHHGCILLESNLSELTHALRVKPDKIVSKSCKSVRSRVTTINEHLPQPVTVDAFKKLLCQYASGSLTPVAAGQVDDQAIQDLKAQKYATWAWNFGHSPKCSLRKDRRFPFGGVSLYLDVADGMIQTASIRGDFFGRKELGPLEGLLTGKRMVPEDLAFLHDVDVDAYIAGMTPQLMIDLICY